MNEPFRQHEGVDDPQESLLPPGRWLDRTSPLDADGTLATLFTDFFIQKYTRFTSFQVMLDSGSLIDLGAQGFDSPAWHSFIQAFTDFPDWATMLRAAHGDTD